MRGAIALVIIIAKDIVVLEIKGFLPLGFRPEGSFFLKEVDPSKNDIEDTAVPCPY